MARCAGHLRDEWRWLRALALETNERPKLVTRKHANVRVWRTAAVVVARSTKIEVSATFISMIARSDQTADLCLDQDGAELMA